MKSNHSMAAMSQANFANDPIAVQKEAHQKLRRAEILRQNRKLDEAEKICLSMLRKFPHYYGALHTIGLVYADKGRHEQAMLYLAQAAMINPRSWTTLTALSGVYLALGSAEMASRVLCDALQITTEEPTIYYTLADIYYDQKEYVQAAEACQKALVLEPDMEEALFTLARTCVSLGQYAEAREALERVVKLKPMSLKALVQLSTLPARLIQLDLIAELEKVVSNAKETSSKNQVSIAFVRATAFDKMQCYEEAWQWAIKANALFESNASKQVSQELESVEHRASWLAKNLQKYKGKRNVNKDFPASVFVLGPSRSGKTTAESILSAQRPVCRGYENPAIGTAIAYGYNSGGLLAFSSIAQLPHQLYSNVRDYYKEIICGIMGDDQFFTNTHPGHIWDAPILSEILPNTKYVFIKRNFFDLALRIFLKNYRSGHLYSYNLKNIERYVAAYNRMIDLMSEALPQDSIIINYEDMVTNPGRALDQMSELCGITPDHGLLPEVADDTGCSEPYKELIKAALAEN